jgi:hypothetical protein
VTARFASHRDVVVRRPAFASARRHREGGFGLAPVLAGEGFGGDERGALRPDVERRPAPGAVFEFPVAAP